MSFIKSLLHSLLRKCGYDILRYNLNNFISVRRKIILGQTKVDLVIDIGAHDGSYGAELRHSGYKKRIISFEPLTVAFNILKDRCFNDLLWSCSNRAIGNFNGKSTLNVSGNYPSSSLLKMTKEHIRSLPTSSIKSQELVEVVTLDSLLNELKLGQYRIYLKLDVQGYERIVLDGAVEVIKYVKVIEIELSLVKLYDDSPIYYEMISYLRSLGFHLVSITPGFSDPDTGYLLQVDGIFVRKTA